MHSIFFKSLALLSLAQLLSAARVHIENTQPPANKYVTHCTVQIDGAIYGCEDASSEPYPKGCGGNSGSASRQICMSAAVTVDWDSDDVTVKFRNNEGDEASCKLGSADPGSSCELK
ncbi:hypothetical protein N7492_001635 [Penicillium capsulatum]|uniref:Uncharacterized protein n=1 Tax=Penicillium capsulatum TaxID=69766 RepID=A0A9W9IS37_9EURO|nr:hypothetical protein N7492_001635 [Penicillium capsulatum]KAJ6129312.1 hypothetical protein N7512_002092 [Penicillium capsulatum]